MRLTSFLTMICTLAAAAALCLVTAYFSVLLIEDASKMGVETELEGSGLGWADVDVSGLEVFLFGTAPDEAARFRAISAAGRVVDAARIIDQMDVAEAEEILPPTFSVELLRNASGINAIGLIPTSTDLDDVMERLSEINKDGKITEFVEAANFPAPDGWERTLTFAIGALRDLPQSKISVISGRVTVIASADSQEAKTRAEITLARRKPDNLDLQLDISAPRPVISPFTLRFAINELGPHFDACAVDTAEGRERIVAAAERAGMAGQPDCTLALGAPTKNWSQAASLAIDKLAELGAGSVTFSNADVTLTAIEGTSQILFNRVVGELESALPDVFVLKATLPVAPDADDEGPRDFVATLSPEGSVQLRGRVASGTARVLTESFAKARFGSNDVLMAARVDAELPANWQTRILASLEALSLLENGSITMTAESADIYGRTGNEQASTEIASLLVEKLGPDTLLDIKIEYVRRLDPVLALPSPAECVADIRQIIGDRKISFEPGAAVFDSTALAILDDLAEHLKRCEDIQLEIGGHTDSQGRETMNQTLSKDRAQAVLDALRSRRVRTSLYTVVGYGETMPIASNDTGEGREVNRRIEFKLITPDPVDTIEDTSAQPVETIDETAPSDDVTTDSDDAAETVSDTIPADQTTSDAETAQPDQVELDQVTEDETEAGENSQTEEN